MHAAAQIAAPRAAASGSSSVRAAARSHRRASASSSRTLGSTAADDDIGDGAGLPYRVDDHTASDGDRLEQRTVDRPTVVGEVQAMERAAARGIAERRARALEGLDRADPSRPDRPTVGFGVELGERSIRCELRLEPAHDRTGACLATLDPVPGPARIHPARARASGDRIAPRRLRRGSTMSCRARLRDARARGRRTRVPRSSCPLSRTPRSCPRRDRRAPPPPP